MRELQETLPQLDPQDPRQLLHLVSLYLAVGSSQKASEYLARARKRAIERDELAALLEQIELLQTRMKEANSL